MNCTLKKGKTLRAWQFETDDFNNMPDWVRCSGLISVSVSEDYEEMTAEMTIEQPGKIISVWLHGYIVEIAPRVLVALRAEEFNEKFRVANKERK